MSININHGISEMPSNLSETNHDLLRALNVTIQDVTVSIESFHFNTAVASIRSFFNYIVSYEITNTNDEYLIFYSSKNLLILLNPMVPHIAEELWEILVKSNMICNEVWPIVDEFYLQKNHVEIPIQVNGKIRALINVPIGTNKEELEILGLKENNVKKFLSGEPKKVIIIPDRIVNFVI